MSLATYFCIAFVFSCIVLLQTIAGIMDGTDKRPFKVIGWIILAAMGFLWPGVILYHMYTLIRRIRQGARSHG